MNCLYSVPRRITWVSRITLGCAIAAFAFAEAPAQDDGVAQVAGPEVRLKTGSFTLGREISAAVRTEIGKDADGAVPVYAQFEGIPDPLQRDELEAAGLRLVGYLGDGAWTATLARDDRGRALLDSGLERFRLRALDTIPPGDKLATSLSGAAPEDAYDAEGRRYVVVHFFPGVEAKQRDAVLDAAGAVGAVLAPVGGTTVAALDEEGLGRLAREDAVAWIEPVAPRGAGESDRARAFLQVDAAQTAGFDGDGVTVGVFEAGHVWKDHPDFGTRVSQGDTDPYDPAQHTTFTGGFIAGDGGRSAAADVLGPGAARQYRGMAPAAELLSYDFWLNEGGTWADAYTNYLGDLLKAVNTDKIDVGNNSWGTTGGCSVIAYGAYDELTDELDAAVAGALEFESPTILVFSAGNERDGFSSYDAATGTWSVDTSCLTQTVAPFANYDTLNHPKSAKNIIVVGAVDSAFNRQMSFTSWGPTDDGRLKPDVVSVGAHGAALNTGVSEINNAFGTPTGDPNQQAYRTPNYRNPPTDTFWYGWYSQTSAAAASVSGGIAQIIDAWHEKMRTEQHPLPATVRAMLAHSARDLDDGTPWHRPGPDYASGYGVVQIDDAIDLIGTGQIVQGKINSARPDVYTIDVPAGTTDLKFTLAWDDPPPAPAAASALVNDLDLVVTDPTGTRYSAWTLDPANPDANAVRTAPNRRDNMEQVLVDSTVTGGPLPAGTWEVRVELHALPEGPQRYGLVGSERLVGAVDLMLVLDRSGSMTGAASAGMPDSKIETLRSAATQLVDTMRVDEGYQLGLTQFNQNVVAFAPAHEANLDLHTSARATTLKTLTIPSITAGGATSIGDGLRDALNQLTGSPSPARVGRAILLVTDGKENSAELISGVKSDLISADVTVNVLGLGYSSGVDEARLIDLASDTGGSYRITADHLAFRKLFLEALAGVVDWSLVMDPPGLITSGESVDIPFTLAADETGALATVQWEGLEGAVALELIDPSGDTVDTDSAGLSVRHVAGERYALIELDPPLRGALAGQWAGEWRLRVHGTDAIQGGTVRYAASVYTRGGVKLSVETRPGLVTGEPMVVLARLERAGQPVLGSSLQAIVEMPSMALGPLLDRPTIAVRPTVVAGDVVTPLERKLDLTGTLDQLVKGRETTTVQMFDDGAHNDGRARDGTYGGVFDATKHPGQYAVRVVASKIPAGGRTVTREATLHRAIGLRLDREASLVRIERLDFDEPGGVQDATHAVIVTPRAADGAPLGPGHAVTGVLRNERRVVPVQFSDRLDGRYTAHIALPEQTLAGWQFEIAVDGVPFNHLSEPFLSRKVE